ncbi:MAG: hypothetical protein IJQ80_05235 [Clostridia bacterium]|nr:hypothetical protein [Clostridia bacterium]
MAENTFGNLSGACKETVCIDTYRVLDSCRDRDCFKDVKCYLTSFGQDIIERTDAVRAKYAKVISAFMDVDQVPFNNGFYQLTSRIFVKLICEACISPGNIQEFEALCAVEKKVVLYGGEGSVSVFKSEYGCNAFCPDLSGECCKSGDTLPIAVIETVDPIVLDTKVREMHHHCHCCISPREIPSGVQRYMGGEIVDCERPKILTVSIGLFSVVRIERPCQLLVSAAEYNVPEKQCCEATDDDPCSIFSGIPFPEGEFNSSSARPAPSVNTGCGCRG